MKRKLSLVKKATELIDGSFPYPDPPLKSILTDTRVLKILMLEDNIKDADLIRMYLKSSKLKVHTCLVSSKEEYIEKLMSDDFDIILSEHNLPDFSSLEALRIRNDIKFHIPFILVCGAIPEEYAVTIIQEGANDYILKDRPQRLLTAIAQAIQKQKILSEKIITEQELVFTNERFKLVCKATADAIWDWNLITDEIFWGEGFELLFGHKIDKLTKDHTSWTSCIHPADKVRVVKGIMKVIKGKTSSWFDEYRYLKSDGSIAIVMDKGIVIRNERGKAIRMVGAMQDLTHVRKLEMELQDQNLQHQKNYTVVAIQAQEEEKKSIGKELHDNINQLMASAKMMLDAGRKSPESLDMFLDKCHEAITMSIEETRKLSHAMVPPTFDENNTFLEAVLDIVANINLANTLQVRADIDLRPDIVFDEKIGLTFYRIIQEQLNNILKHAKASEVDINFKIEKKNYQLLISDNGLGFDIEKTSSGIGLKNIESRVGIFAGNMEIITSPGNGCTLKIEIPT